MHPFGPMPKPVVEFGAPHPGAMTMSGGRRRWEGELCWETKHGEATTLWVAGKLAGVYGARLSDGTRVDSLSPGLPESGLWRRTTPAGCYVHGRVELTRDDVLFVDDEKQPRPARFARGSLPAHLLASEHARAAASDKSFAVDLYGSLCSSFWKLRSTGREYKGSWERAGDIVAQLRNRGEICVDFYLNGNEGIVTESVVDLLGDLGWELARGPDDPAGRARRAERLVEVCEARPVGDLPDWYVHWIGGLREDDDLDARMHRAAFEGKVPYTEWVKFWELFDFGEG